MATTRKKPAGLQPPKAPTYATVRQATVSVVMLTFLTLGGWFALSLLIPELDGAVPALDRLPPFTTSGAVTIVSVATGLLLLAGALGLAQGSAHRKHVIDFDAATELHRAAGTPTARLRVYSRDGRAPVDVRMKGAPVDDKATVRVQDAFARTAGCAANQVRTERLRGGGTHVWVDTKTPPEEPDPEPDDAPAPVDRILSVAEGALVGPGKHGLIDIETVARHKNGAQSHVRLHYSPNLAADLGDRIANLMPLLNRTVPSQEGRWSATWQPRDDMIELVDEPDLLADKVPLQPLDPNLDVFTGVPIGIDDHGRPYRLPIADGAHVLIAGETGSGKGSYVWGVIRALAPLVRSGLVRLWVGDPKGGLELGVLEGLVHKFTVNTEETIEMLEEVAGLVTVKSAELRAQGAAGRKMTTPTRDMPYDVIVVDELNTMGGHARYLAASNHIMQLGRAAGMFFMGALQNPDKGSIKNRDRFTVKVALRLAEAAQVPMVLGPGARARGAFADSIPSTQQGTAYVLQDGKAPLRVRAAYIDDDEIDRVVKIMGGKDLTPPDLTPSPTGPVQDELDTDGAVIVEAAVAIPVRVAAPPRAVPATVTPHVLAAMLTSTHTKGVRVRFDGDTDEVLVKDVQEAADEGRWELTYIYDGEPTSRVSDVDEDEQFTFV